MDSGHQKVILMIADISGYTSFMVSNKTSLTHAQVISTELIQKIIKRLEIPLKISKFEGDAVFFYTVKNDTEEVWKDTKRTLGEKLISFFEVFSEKVAEFSHSNICDCSACKNVENLKLKIMVHSGEALFYQIGKFYELSGVDVIILHRLLKNSVQSNQYILMTETAYKDIEFPHEINVTKGQEEYGEIGKIKTFIYMEPRGLEHHHDRDYSATSYKARNALVKIFHSMLIKMKLKKLPAFNNLSP